MLIHEELRSAREEAGLSQAELAARAGIPRNQIVRAEKGENITLDTLRKIAAQLPVENLTLLESVDLRIDVLLHPEKLFLLAEETVLHLTRALAFALHVAAEAREAMEHARRASSVPGSAEDEADVESPVLFDIARKVQTLPFYPKAVKIA